MTKFILKFKDKEITLFQDKEKIGETEDAEEAFAFIANTIKKEHIRGYEVIVWDNGKKEVLDFDHNLVLQNSKDYDFDDDSENNHHQFDEDPRDPRFNRQQPKRHGFVYTSTTTVNDYEKLGWAFRDALTPERRVREQD